MKWVLIVRCAFTSYGSPTATGDEAELSIGMESFSSSVFLREGFGVLYK
jgi:hypothetical protein